jgi:hypothetical protein
MTGRLTMMALTLPGIWWVGQYVHAVFDAAAGLF